MLLAELPASSGCLIDGDCAMSKNANLSEAKIYGSKYNSNHTGQREIIFQVMSQEGN